MGGVDRPDGLLKALTKTVIEIAFDEEITDHLGYDKHDPAGRSSGNSRNCEYEWAPFRPVG